MAALGSRSPCTIEGVEGLFPAPCGGDEFAAREELTEQHQRYVTEVSAPEHAVSLELASFLLAFCRERNPAEVLDLGSGFSSYVLRLYAAGSGVAVTSVDTDASWLDRSRSFCEGLPEGRFMTWRDFGSWFPEQGSYDVVLHDMGDMIERVTTLPQALMLTRHGVRSTTCTRPATAGTRVRLDASANWYLDLSKITYDGLGRFSYLVKRI